MPTKNKLGLSFDVESIAPQIKDDEKASTVSELERTALLELLKILDRNDSFATFFIVSEHFEVDLIAEIFEQGHEIGSHTCSHRSLSSLPPSKQHYEIFESKKTLETITGGLVEGFRAPLFDRPAGFFSLLTKGGYTYDSSMVPSIPIPGRYGGDDVDMFPFRRSDQLIEIPVSVDPRYKIPISGLWLRLLGKRMVKRSLSRLISNGYNPVLYFHPYELFKLPNYEGVTRRSRFRTGNYVKSFVQWLAERFNVVPIKSLVR